MTSASDGTILGEGEGERPTNMPTAASRTRLGVDTQGLAKSGSGKKGRPTGPLWSAPATVPYDAAFGITP